VSNKVTKLIFEHYHADDARSRARKFCLLVLAWFADDEGRSIYPGPLTIARYLGSSVRHSKRILSELVRRGEVLPVGNANGGHHGATRRYEIAPALLVPRPTNVVGPPKYQQRLTPMSCVKTRHG
jgi:hypothetical protein